MQKFLIVNADDFGLHGDINKGIELAIREGIVKSVSFVTNTAYFQDSLSIIKQYPDVSVGVHLNIVDEKPLSSSDNLKFLLNNKDVFLGNHLKVIYSIIYHPTHIQQIKFEFELQIKRLLDNNISISHLNSHCYIHLLPCLFKVVLELARRFRIPFIRVPREKIFLRDYYSRWDIVGVNALSGYLINHNFKNGQLKHTDHFFGLRYAGKLTKQRLIKAIRQLDYGLTEIVVHPGYDDYVLSEKFQWNYLWHEELLALIDNKIKEEIKNSKVDLVSFHQIL